MSINQNNEFIFDGDDEPKKYKSEFQTNQFKFSVKESNRPSPRWIIEWEIIRWIKMDKKSVLSFDHKSKWWVYSDKLVHDDTELIFEPDDSYLGFIIPSLLGIMGGEFFGDAAGSFILTLFDHTEVHTLKEQSLFKREFPKFFQYREKSFLKTKESLIKKSMRS